MQKDPLAIGDRNAGQFERHAGGALDAACLVQLNNSSQDTRACFRDHQAVGYKLMIKRRGECVTFQIAVGGETLS